jgi:integrase
MAKPCYPPSRRYRPRGPGTLGDRAARPWGSRTGATMNRYKAALSAAYQGRDRSRMVRAQGQPRRPVSAVAKESSHRFGRSLEDDERGAPAGRLRPSTWPGLGVFVRVALATGARRGELLKLEWRDVDLKAGSILLRDTKNADDRRVPLIGDAKEPTRSVGQGPQSDGSARLPRIGAREGAAARLGMDRSQGRGRGREPTPT